MALLIGVGVLAVIALIVIVLYNRLVAIRNQVGNAWKQIDVQLKRRHDLIPNLVEVVKDYMSYEQVMEAYPDLKANQNVGRLMEELTGTENKISFARQFYNDSVMSLNNMVQSFPSNMIAGMFGFQPGTYFEVPEAETAAPKVDLR